MKPWVWMILGALVLVYVLAPLVIGILALAARLFIMAIAAAVELAPFLIGAAVIILVIKACRKKTP